ncbi:hypothetical protein EGH21_20565 [Halomicroarcula sp. F13]|uniref:Yip1 domain-containing protein n=1 Tax=Haloarcula rubra TaxID=2487747 RepID=A0AAW4PZA4_9EURY|nr:hypothetical protein [Halomicroarcula rubra]MBX0325424.1 hypothetical protein [Halomicroarcula rubra]
MYLVNLVAYAIPLTLAGIGIQSSQRAPAGFADVVSSYGIDATASWQLLVAFVQNSLFISIATAITLVTFHVGVLIVRDSQGIVQSMHTVVYTTSAYLVATFSAVWYLTNQAGVSGARQLVRTLQAAFVYAIIDALGAGLELPGGRPNSLGVETISTQGQWILAILTLTLLYYLFSLYLGARINHRATRSNAVIAVIAVALSPVVYVTGSIITYIIA